MPTYEFTGPIGRAFMDLQHGVDGVTVATLDEERAHVDGQTVGLEPGDHLTTVDPVEHPDLTETTPAAVPTKGRKTPAEPPADTVGDATS